jgi:tape measure domain-containing protein
MADDKIIRIKIDGGSAIAGANKTNRAVKGIGSSADKSSGSLLKMKGVATALITALGTSALVRYSDSWTSINNQIKQATKTTIEALAVQEALFQIAKDSRVELQGVANAYQRISNSVADYGFSAKDSLDVVEGLTKAFKSNGATAQEVSSVLVQLGQGLGAGALQGEELRAVLEASLPVSRALAKEFGVTVGQLKDLGAAGKLTTERVFVALQNALPEFESAFDKANKTIAEGITVTNSSITRLVGLTNDATGAGNALANGLIDLSSAIDFLGDAVESGAAGKIAELFSAQLDLIGKDVIATTDFIFNSFDNLGGGLEASTTATTEFIGQAFLNIIPNIRTLTQVITVEIAAGMDKLKEYGKAIEATLNPFDDVSVDQARGKFGRATAKIDEDRKKTLQSIFDKREAEKAAQKEKILEAEALIEKYKQEREARQLSLSGGEIGGATSSTAGDSPPSGGAQGGDSSVGEDLTAKLQLENQMIQQSLLNRQNIYSNFYDAANDLEANEYERQRAQLAFNLATQMQQEDADFQARLQAITDRQLLIADNKALNDAQKDEANSLLNEQAVLARQEFENRITEIAKDGAAQRAQIEQKEASNKISTYQGYANTALSLAQSFGSKSEKSQKRLRRVGVVIDTAAGISRAFAENPYPVAIGLSAAIAATGIAQLKAINSASPSSSSIGGASTASTTTAATSSATTASDTQNTKRIIDLRGFDNGGYLTKEQLTELLSGDEDVIVASNSGQQQGARVGLING